MKILWIILITIFYSCNSNVDVDIDEASNFKEEAESQPIITNSPPTAANVNPDNGLKNFESIITLDYTDTEGDEASSCSVSNLNNLTETTSCSCSSGICTVGVTPTLNHIGATSFEYLIIADGASSNTAMANLTIDNLGASLSDEWVEVPANAGGMGLPKFYVMKYEAKAWNDINSDQVVDGGEVDTNGQAVATGSNLPISIPANQPWREISALDAATECESLGANYHIISNAEWMAMARDIENVDENWTGLSVGTGCLYRGNSGEATTGTGVVDGDSCGYDGGNPEEGTGRDIRARHLLSNDEEIYDLSGNVWEWTDWNPDLTGFQAGPTTCTAAVVELPTVACGDLIDGDYNTINGTYTSADGVGQFNGGTGGGARHGGSWNFTTGDGVFSLHLNIAPTNTSQFFGFRCVFRP